MKRYDTLIIGAGRQASEADHPNSEKIISFAHALNEHNGFDKVTFYDKDYKKAMKAAEKWNQWWTINYENILHANVVIITTPDDTHYEILKNIAYHPFDLVIVEKPITTNLEQAREIVELYKQKNIPLMVNYTRRFLPYYQELKRLYDLGLFGEIKETNLYYNRGLIHTATHGIDLFNWFFGDKINPKIEYVGHESYRVWRIKMLFNKYFWEETRFKEEKVWEYYDFSHWYVIENAYNFLEGKEALKCTGEDGLKALEIAFELKVNET